MTNDKTMQEIFQEASEKLTAAPEADITAAESEKQEPTPEQEETSKAKGEEKPQAEEEKKPQADDLPAAWRSKERKQVWEKFDPETRAAITKREAEMAAGFFKRNEDAELGKALSGVVSSAKPLAESRGVKVQELFKEYAQFDSFLSSNASIEQKAELIGKLAASYGVPIGNVKNNSEYEKNTLPNGQNYTSSQTTPAQSDVRKIIRETLEQERQSALIGSFESSHPEFSDERIRQMTANILISNILPEGMSEQESLESAFSMAKNLFPEYRTQQAPVSENQGRRNPASVISSVPVKSIAEKQVQYKPGDSFDDIFKTALRMGSLN